MNGFDPAAERRKSVATAEGRGLEGGSLMSRGAAEESFAAPRLFLFLAFAASLFGQDQPFTIRVNTRLVVQTVSVTGKDGKPIEDLTKDDFILTEDGIPQTIGIFEFEKL